MLVAVGSASFTPVAIVWMEPAAEEAAEALSAATLTEPWVLPQAVM